MVDKGSRVVIKIKQEKNRSRKELIDPKMVTVWHKGRILSALVILILLIVMVGFLFSGEETQENKPLSLESVKPVQTIKPVQKNPIPIPPVEEKPVEAKPVESNQVSPEPIKPVSVVEPSPKKVTSTEAQTKQPPAIIFDRRVIRASLTTAPKYGEPGEPIKPRVTIVPGQSIEAFYFSEIRGMKHQVLFHHWFKNGELVYKKPFDVETYKFKLISSKKLSEKDVGEWRVALIDQKGKRFSEVNFSVNP